jgi:ADP-glucose pyrophosphorylase
MPGVYIGHGAYVEKAIIGPDAVVENDCAVLGGARQAIAVVGHNAVAFSKKINFAHYTANQV